jgi:hypothetical protein
VGRRAEGVELVPLPDAPGVGVGVGAVIGAHPEPLDLEAVALGVDDQDAVVDGELREQRAEHLAELLAHERERLGAAVVVVEPLDPRLPEQRASC